MKVSEAYERYRRDVIVFGDKSPKTEEQYICSLRSLVRFGGDIELKDLNLEHIRKWKNNLKEGNAFIGQKPLALRTIRGYMMSLRAVLGHLRILGYECLDPNRLLIPARVERKPNVISPEEVTKLLWLVDQTINCTELLKARNKAMIALLYGSGLRISELRSLNRDDVKRDVFSVIGKGQKEGLCMMDARTRKYINHYLSLREDNSEVLFIDNIKGERLSASTIQRLFRRLSIAGNFKEPVHPHTLRHSYATNLLINGCHLYTLMRLMRHTSVATTQIYLHHHDAELIEAHKKYHSV